uniref:Uncharacterized protein n=1 Tax=Amorphochlora amoebiformis TaxID=1561963 RepID=A0A7S0DKI5_9EUKA
MTAPYHRSTTNSQPPDVELVAALRKWAANVELPIINPEYKDSRGGLDQFTKKGPKIELICKIIGITKPRGNNPRYLVVWDATDVMLEESVVQIEREDCIMLEDDEGPVIGGYFPVQVEEKILSQLTIIPGDWVHLQNVSIQCTARGQEYFGYAEDARVLCASLLDCQKVEKKCAMRMKKELEDVESENKLSRSCITKDLNINFFHSIVSMVSEFSPVPGNFQLRAKITRVEPTDPKEWCKLYCEKCMSTQTADKKTLRCTECKRKKKLKWEFYLILTLADETGVQDVIVSRDEANFFLQAKPCNLEDKENEEMVQNFEKIVDIITQPNSWGYFFVRSVMTQGEEEEDEAPEYFLENTQLDFQA